VKQDYYQTQFILMPSLVLCFPGLGMLYPKLRWALLDRLGIQNLTNSAHSRTHSETLRPQTAPICPDFDNFDAACFGIALAL
jgi:hypothetical protein